MFRGCLVVMVVVAAVCLGPAPAQAGFDFSSLISNVADDVIDRLYVERDINLLDHYCVLSRSPHFYRWELKWRASVTCPGWTPVMGRASGFANPNTSEREATKDFVKKIVERGLVTREDAKEWL